MKVDILDKCGAVKVEKLVKLFFSTVLNECECPYYPQRHELRGVVKVLLALVNSKHMHLHILSDICILTQLPHSAE